MGFPFSEPYLFCQNLIPVTMNIEFSIYVKILDLQFKDVIPQAHNWFCTEGCASRMESLATLMPYFVIGYAQDETILNGTMHSSLVDYVMTSHLLHSFESCTKNKIHLLVVEHIINAHYKHFADNHHHFVWISKWLNCTPHSLFLTILLETLAFVFHWRQRIGVVADLCWWGSRTRVHSRPVVAFHLPEPCLVLHITGVFSLSSQYIIGRSLWCATPQLMLL